MSDKPLKGPQLRSLPSFPEDFFQVTMDLDKNDDLISQRGVHFEHWAAIPSPIGLKERGDYRRSDQLDTVSSNGMIYKKKGCFLAALVSNHKSKSHSIEGGVFDHSTARLIVPRFYIDNEEVHLAPGDRVYIKDMEVLVPNYQRMEHNPNGVDKAQFPIKCVEFLIDSANNEYKQGIHFQLIDGNISWINGKSNPGTDVDTGKGRIYAVRYKYNAHWYITDIPNEIRVIQVTKDDGSRVPARMPYSAIIQREYVYFNQNNGENIEEKPREKEVRRVEKPKEPEEVSEFQLKVDMRNIE